MNKLIPGPVFSIVTPFTDSLDIDFDSEIIIGSVVINGSVGMDQPDSFEFDFLSNMNVDSIKYYGQETTFIHQDNIIKIPAPEVTIPEGYNFSITIFYHGSPQQCGAAVSGRVRSGCMRLGHRIIKNRKMLEATSEFSSNKANPH